MAEPTDDEIEAMVETNPIKALILMAERAGCTPTLYGQPVTAEQLERAATAQGVARLTGEPLTPDEVKTIAKN